MTEEILERIDTKLDIIIRLLAGKYIEGKGKTESILALSALGLDTNLIAEIVGTTPGTVSTRLSEVKKKGESRGEKSSREARTK